MNLKVAVVLFALASNFCPVLAKSDSSLMGKFDIEPAELSGATKTFINNSKYNFVIRWKLFDPETMLGYSQEPILKQGDLITINHDKGLKYMEKAKNIQYSLEILRVKQMPKGAGVPLVTSKLKDGSLALAIHKSKYLNHDTFSLSLNKNGLLVCKASK